MPVTVREVLKGTAVVFGIIVLIILMWTGFKEVKRYQQRADAKNRVTVAERKVDQIKAEADQRRAEADGIRDAQDKIAATLTPLYVQHEAIQKLPQARAVYVPSGAQGIPQVQDVGTPLPAPGK